MYYPKLNSNQVWGMPGFYPLQVDHLALRGDPPAFQRVEGIHVARVNYRPPDCGLRRADGAARPSLSFGR